jgi:hypothetical protein
MSDQIDDIRRVAYGDDPPEQWGLTPVRLLLNAIRNETEHTFWEADDLVVTCEEFSSVDQDGDDHYGLRLTITDTDGESLAILDSPSAVERLAARIAEAVAHPKPE